MPRCNHVRYALITALAGTLIPVVALAQTGNRGDVSASTSVTAVYTFNTDLDRGGDFHWGTGIVSGTVTRQVTSHFAAGVTLRYDYENWKFGSPAAFGGQVPWGTLNAPNIAFNFTYAVAPDLTIGVTSPAAARIAPTDSG